MSNYSPVTEKEKQEMLNTIGAASIDDLFSDIPQSIKAKAQLNLPDGLPEQDTFLKIREMADKNKVYKTIFRGAGAYRHYIPAVVDTVASKEELVTA